MAREILWLDNDLSWIDPYIEAIRRNGHNVTQVTTVTKAEEALRARAYDLLILDVMIPIKSEEEETLYPAELTKGGTETGLVFYRRVKSRLKDNNTALLAMTVRLDERIKDAFIAEGLSPENFSTRLTLRDVAVFIEKVNTLLRIQ